jgi:hypothetical protein
MALAPETGMKGEGAFQLSTKGIILSTVLAEEGFLVENGEGKPES